MKTNHKSTFLVLKTRYVKFDKNETQETFETIYDFYFLKWNFFSLSFIDTNHLIKINI
jgi:hypothetical protein